MRLDKFTLKAQEALEQAREIASGYDHQEIGLEHLFLALIQQKEGVASSILKKLGVNVNALAGQVTELVRTKPKVYGGGVGRIYINAQIQKVLEHSWNEALRLKDEYVSCEHILVSIIELAKDELGSIIKSQGIKKDDVYKALIDIRGSQRITDPNPEEKYEALKKFGRDLTDMARQGKIDPVIGRDSEIRRIAQVLSRRTKNNPVLIGIEGVGYAISTETAMPIIQSLIVQGYVIRPCLGVDTVTVIPAIAFWNRLSRDSGVVILN